MVAAENRHVAASHLEFLRGALIGTEGSPEPSKADPLSARNLKKRQFQCVKQTSIREGGGLEVWLNVQIKHGRIKLKRLHSNQKNIDPGMLLCDFCMYEYPARDRPSPMTGREPEGICPRQGRSPGC